jgi:hypothetical protein
MSTGQPPGRQLKKRQKVFGGAGTTFYVNQTAEVEPVYDSPGEMS